MNHMKKFRALEFNHAVPASFSRQLVATLIDALLLMIVLSFTIIGANSIVANTQTYQSSETLLRQERVAVYQIEEEARVYQFVDNQNGQYETLRPLEDIFTDYALQQILLSYQQDPTPFSTYQVNVDNPNNLQPSSFSTDQLAYFYVHYAALYNTFNQQVNDVVDFEGDTPEVYYYRTLKRLSPTSDYWVFDETNHTYPYLKGTFAVDLYIYLFEDDSHQAGLTNYNKLAVAYQAIWQEQVNALVSSSRFKTHFDQYLFYYEKCANMIQVSTILSYVISFLIVFLLPQLIFKNMQSIGKKVMKIKVIDEEGYRVLASQFVIRNLFSFIFYVSALLIPMILTGGFQSGMMYPIFEIIGLGVSLFHISVFAVLISILAAFSSIFLKNHAFFHDFVGRTTAMDDRYSDLIAEVNQDAV